MMSKVFKNLIIVDQNIIMEPINLRELISNREERKDDGNEVEDMFIVFEPNQFYKHMLETGM